MSTGVHVSRLELSRGALGTRHGEAFNVPAYRLVGGDATDDLVVMVPWIVNDPRIVAMLDARSHQGPIDMPDTHAPSVSARSAKVSQASSASCNAACAAAR